MLTQKFLQLVEFITDFSALLFVVSFRQGCVAASFMAVVKGIEYLLCVELRCEAGNISERQTVSESCFEVLRT